MFYILRNSILSSSCYLLLVKLLNLHTQREEAIYAINYDVTMLDACILAHSTATLLPYILQLLLLQLLDWLDSIVPQFDLSSEGEEACTPNSPAVYESVEKP